MKLKRDPFLWLAISLLTVALLGCEAGGYNHELIDVSSEETEAALQLSGGKGRIHH